MNDQRHVFCKSAFQKKHTRKTISGLGVNHEQKRADGSHEYYGKGPHLQMFWENTESWKSQYTPATNSYIGSAYDGGEDPQVGYAPYDFVSWTEKIVGSKLKMCHFWRELFSCWKIRSAFLMNTISFEAFWRGSPLAR